MLIDPDYSVWSQYGMGYIPHNVVIDPNMVVRYTYYGYTEATLINIIETWLPTETTVTYNFPQQGWYLISLPVTPTDNNLSNLFPTALGAYAFDPLTGYSPVNSLDPRKGYWLLIPGAANSTISGTPLTNYTEHFEIGWHLIGSVMGTTNFTDPDDNPHGSVIATHGWNATVGQYFHVYPPGTGVLEPMQGYWLAVAQPCDLTIASGSLSKATEVANMDHVKLQVFYQQFGSQPPMPPLVSDPNQIQYKTSEYVSLGNYPNPFNSRTVIGYWLPNAEFTSVYIYNNLGQKIRTIVEAQQSAGIHHVIWDGRNGNGEPVSSGIYFYRIVNSEFSEINKILLLR